VVWPKPPAPFWNGVPALFYQILQDVSRKAPGLCLTDRALSLRSKSWGQKSPHRKNLEDFSEFYQGHFLMSKSGLFCVLTPKILFSAPERGVVLISHRNKTFFFLHTVSPPGGRETVCRVLMGASYQFYDDDIFQLVPDVSAVGSPRVLHPANPGL